MATDADHAALSVGRLLDAVDALLSEQAMVLQTERYDAFLALQERTQPLVTRIAELMGTQAANGIHPALKQRGLGVLQRMNDLEALVADHRRCVSRELGTLSASLARTQRLHPVYRSHGGRQPQTNLLAHA